MDKEIIYTLLKEHDANATMIAKSLNVTPQAVHKVITDGFGSEKIARAIATICGKDYRDLFPYYLKEKEKKEKAIREKRQAEIDKKLAKLA